MRPTGHPLAAVLRAGPLGESKLPGASLGPYVVESTLGRGGMGVVFKAHHAPSGQVVALKVLLSGEGASLKELKRFRREGRVGQGLSQAGVVGVLDAGEADGLAYLAFEFVEGSTLSDLQDDVSPAEFLDLFRQVAETVAAAHTGGVIHRDLKPDNILVRTADRHALLSDFGLARDLNLSSSLTKTGAAVGTVSFMPPEQIKGKPLTPAADVFALGVILYRGLTGEEPWRPGNLALRLAAIMTERPAKPSSVNDQLDPALDRVCLKALAPKLEHRYADAGELLADLEAALRGERSRASRLPLALGAAAVVLALGAAGLVGSGDAPPASPAAETAEATRPPGITRLEVDASFARVARSEGAAERRAGAEQFLERHPAHPGALALLENTTGWERVPHSGPWPSPRSTEAGVYHAETASVVVFGGRLQLSPTSATNEVWGYRAGTWRQIHPLLQTPIPRHGHAYALDSLRDRLVVFAGMPNSGDKTELRDTWEGGLDGSWTLRAAGKANPAYRYGHALAFDPVRREVVLFGGRASPTDYFADTWVWDGDAWTQRRVPGPRARQAHRMLWDARHERIVLFAGHEEAEMFSDLWAWDGEQWSELPQEGARPAGRRGCGLAATDDGRLVLFGGGAVNASVPFSDTWVYDEDRWIQRSPIASPPPTASPALVWDARRRRVVLFGGRSLQGSTTALSNDVWELPVPERTSTDERWAPSPEAPPPAEVADPAHEAAVANLVVLPDGPSKLERARALLEKRPDDRTVQAVAAHLRGWRRADPPRPHPAPRDGVGSSFVYSPKLKAAVLFGGWNQKDLFGDLWAYDGAWRLLDRGDSSASLVRYAAVLSWDPLGDRLIMLGGKSRRREVRDLWTWSDGWAAVRGQTAPNPRLLNAAFDRARGVLVAFNGAFVAREKPATWEWDGARWANRTPADGPSPRLAAAMCFDPSRNRVLMLNVGQTSELWSWSGSRWEQLEVSGPSPPARTANGLVATPEGLVLFGGRSLDNWSFNDTWVLREGSWAERNPVTRPPNMAWFGMVYDTQRQLVVVVCGQQPNRLRTADVWEYPVSR